MVNVWAWDKVKLGLRFTTKRAQDPKTRNKVAITNGFTKCKVQFKPLTPLSSSFGGWGSSNLETSSPLKFITTPLLWNIEDMYKVTKRPH